MRTLWTRSVLTRDVLFERHRLIMGYNTVDGQERNDTKPRRRPRVARCLLRGDLSVTLLLGREVSNVGGVLERHV